MGVNLYVNLDTLQLVDGPGGRNSITALRFKRGDAAKLEVAFLASGTTATSIGNPDTLELHFGIKPRNRYDAGYLVHSTAWTLPAPDATTPVYQCSPSFNTVELDAEFGIGSSTGAELAEITLMGEITWREGAGQPTSTRTFLVVVENDVNRGTEGVPLTAEPAYPAPANIITMSTLGNHAVRFDVVQSLSDAQKAQARANIGAGTGGGGVALDGENVWTGHNAFGGVNITTAHAGWAWDLYFKNPDTGDVDALPLGTSGQVLTVTPEGAIAWASPSGGGASVSWAGEFSFGTPYTAGQVVSYTSVKYLCLADNSNEIPDYSSNWVSFGQTSGFLTFRSEYSEYIPYAIGDIVTLSGVYYLCIAATTIGTAPHTSPYNWVRLSSEYRGEWDALAYYSIGSIVTYGGTLYIAISPNGNSMPADYPALWTPLGAAPSSEPWVDLGVIEVDAGTLLTNLTTNPPVITSATEAFEFEFTLLADSHKLYYVDLMPATVLDFSVISQTLTDGGYGLSVIAFDNSGMMELDVSGDSGGTYYLKTGDKYNFKAWVPDADLYMYSPNFEVLNTLFSPQLSMVYMKVGVRCRKIAR